MRGRKPIPAVLKLHRGNPGKHKLRLDEPIPDYNVEKPECLTGMASDIWDETAPTLIEHGLLTTLDTYTFMGYCIVTARYLEGDTSKGMFREMLNYAAMFGITPGARQRRFGQTELPNLRELRERYLT